MTPARRRVPFHALLVALVVAQPVLADTILYATAASVQGVDGFCLHADGSLDPSPSVQVQTGGTFPRRLVVHADPTTGQDGVLYVAETDRVEAFRIGEHGGLRHLPGTKPLTVPNMDPLDIAVSDDGKTLYVPQNGPSRIAAYPIDAEGAPAEDYTSCLQGPPAAQYQRIRVHGGLLYVSADILGGRISVFPIEADGSLQATPADCRIGATPAARSPVTCPLSERRRLLTPRAFVITGDGTLYVESLALRQIKAFQLDEGGLFEPPFRNRTKEVVAVCLKDANGDALTGNFVYQKAVSKTAVLQQYQDLVLQGATLYASQFTHGRVDAFKLRPDGRLRRHPSRSTQADVRGSPVGLASTDAVLYVAAGEFDLVQAYRLRPADGMLAAATPFSETNALTNSFPNALALVPLSAGCP